MKKFLALLFVCAGLTAMAGVPQFNKAQLVQGKKQAMVLKSNTLANHMTAPVMTTGKSGMTIQQFFADRNLTPNDNKLMKKAPRRVTADDLMTTKIAFMLNYEYNADSGKVVLANDYCSGGWDVDMTQASDNQFNVFLYFTQIPFVMDVDFDAKTAELEVGYLRGWQWKDTTSSGSSFNKTYTVSDTTEILYLVDEETMGETNVAGTIYNDGSVYFEDGFGVYIYQKVLTTQYNRNWVEQSKDSVINQGMYTPFYHRTYLMTANATHDYDYQGNGTTTTHYTNNAYMYQYDDTTARVWNLWQFGYRGTEFYIHEDGSMTFMPQAVGTGDVADLEEAYAAFDWSDGYEFWNLDTITGTVDATSIKWDATTWRRWAYYAAEDAWYTLSYYPMLNNVLTFNDPTVDKFLLGYALDPTIQVTEGATAYTFTGVTTEEGLTNEDVYLAIYDPEAGTITSVVTNPYIVERTTEAQTIYLAAIADGFNIGKNASDWVAGVFTVPALEVPQGLRGDVNDDKDVSIADVTALIDALLSDNWEGLNYDNADCNLDQEVSIGDVTALIDYLLTGVWTD